MNSGRCRCKGYTFYSLPPCMCGTEDQTTEHIRKICPSYQHLIEQIWSDGTSGAVWEERITREDNWLHAAGWLIRTIEKITRRRLYCNHIEIATIEFYISMKTCQSLLRNQCRS